jgi:hypothetical protein
MFSLEIQDKIFPSSLDVFLASYFSELIPGLYVCKAWDLTTTDESRMQSVEMKYLGSVKLYPIILDEVWWY